MAEKKTKPEVKYTRDALLRSNRFGARQDALIVVIDKDEMVTIEEAQERLDKFLRRKVK